MATDLKSLSELVKELEEKKQTVDQAIAEAEQRLKMLRGLRQTIGGGNGKPRTKKPKETTATATG